MRPFHGPRPSSVSRRIQYSKYDASTLIRWLIVRGWRGFFAECALTAPCLAPRVNSETHSQGVGVGQHCANTESSLLLGRGILVDRGICLFDEVIAQNA
jgi:hypothetical protein